MNIALIFAGGIGERMNSKARPKQFLTIHGKPILIYTLEQFEFHPEIDSIIVVCLEEWIHELEKLIERNSIKKVKWIVKGGDTGHDSIYNGLLALKNSGECSGDDIILVHDGVRPLISKELISDNIQTVREKGNAITISKATESVGFYSDEKITSIPKRDDLCIIQAPQTFYFRDIWKVHEQAIEEGYKAVDSAGLMKHFGQEVYTVIGNTYNIKITSPSDYYIFRSIYEAQENLQIFGL